MYQLNLSLANPKILVIAEMHDTANSCSSMCNDYRLILSFVQIFGGDCIEAYSLHFITTLVISLSHSCLTVVPSINNILCTWKGTVLGRVTPILLSVAHAHSSTFLCSRKLFRLIILEAQVQYGWEPAIME